jgi:23S rRNA (guanine745-N1)-methyltransferase
MNHEVISPYLCPLCRQLLIAKERVYQCNAGHSFDVAKAGYVNLLPVHFKNSSVPGDNKAMLVARRAFLEADYYAPMAQSIALLLTNELSHHHQTIKILDIGCGEGYYDRVLKQGIQSDQSVEWHGVDIAKLAITAAAKKLPSVRYCVASNHALPYQEAYFDVLLRIFAPSNEIELKRVLRPQGKLLIVTPGPKHLAQLKAFVYKEVRDHAENISLPDGFNARHVERISYQISPSQQQRSALLQMTPFAWKINKAQQEELLAVEQLIIDVDFIITLADYEEI